MNKQTGKLVIFTAPSGAGKTTIVQHLIAKYPQLGFSISATTRTQRNHEIDGKHYYFISVEEFKNKVAQGDFLEWEEVYENQYYGTLHSEINRLWALGKHIIFDIDVRGAYNIKQAYPDQTLAIFVRPPSIEILFDRLRNRHTETPQSLEKRFARARLEMTYEGKFDVTLVNDVLETVLKEAEFLVEDFLGIQEPCCSSADKI
ncbi:MAG: guanylate kinase [Saprospiraceae bacterium]|nr:guanylate kinase [Saprospiraceae bacterium]MBP7679714.1 guanylate kinase [Saprospiraceae bacterium]